MESRLRFLSLTMRSWQPPPKARASKMLGLINYRLKVTLNDGRQMIGQMLAFDKHMNFVLAECEEFRRVKSKKAKGAAGADKGEPAPEVEQKRTLGLVILRGETIVSVSVEGPPPNKDGEDLKSALMKGPGAGAPAGRGIPLMPPGERPSGWDSNGPSCNADDRPCLF